MQDECHTCNPVIPKLKQKITSANLKRHLKHCYQQAFDKVEEKDFKVMKKTKLQKEKGQSIMTNFFKKYSKSYCIHHFFFFSFWPFPLVRGGHSISSFSTSFCLQCPSPSHQLSSYLLLPHLKIFSLVYLFSSFLVTPFPSSFFLHTLGLSS